MKKLNLTGQRFGKIKILEEGPKTKGGNILWKGECDCGKIKNFYSSHLRRGLSNSCGCSSFDKAKSKHKQWTGCGEISGDFWHSLTRNGNGSKGRKPKEFTITKEYIWNLFLEQNRKCALSGIILIINYRSQRKSKDNPDNVLEHTASLDRIDSSKGYIPGNVQWIHKRINLMKNNLLDHDFIQWCHLISDFNK